MTTAGKPDSSTSAEIWGTEPKCSSRSSKTGLFFLPPKLVDREALPGCVSEHQTQHLLWSTPGHGKENEDTGAP